MSATSDPRVRLALKNLPKGAQAFAVANLERAAKLKAEAAAKKKTTKKSK